MNKTIAVYGSAFNPMHFGHIDCLKQIDTKYEVIIVVPSYSHAFGKKMAPFGIRLNSVKKAISTSGAFSSEIIVSDLEKGIAKKNNDQPVYTFSVLEAISELYNTNSIDFVVGPDNAEPKQWSKFHKADEIIQRWGLVSVEQRKNVRSSLVRELVLKDRTLESITDLVPTNVKRDIQTFNLYQ